MDEFDDVGGNSPEPFVPSHILMERKAAAAKKAAQAERETTWPEGAQRFWETLDLYNHRWNMPRLTQLLSRTDGNVQFSAVLLGQLLPTVSHRPSSLAANRRDAGQILEAGFDSGFWTETDIPRIQEQFGVSVTRKRAGVYKGNSPEYKIKFRNEGYVSKTDTTYDSVDSERYGRSPGGGEVELHGIGRALIGGKPGQLPLIRGFLRPGDMGDKTGWSGRPGIGDDKKSRITEDTPVFDR
jgi:hypothetical protein